MIEDATRGAGCFKFKAIQNQHCHTASFCILYSPQCTAVSCWSAYAFRALGCCTGLAVWGVEAALSRTLRSHTSKSYKQIFESITSTSAFHHANSSRCLISMLLQQRCSYLRSGHFLVFFLFCLTARNTCLTWQPLLFWKRTVEYFKSGI